MKNLIKKILKENQDERYYNYFVSYLTKKFPTLLEKLKKTGGGFSHFVRRGITDEPVFKNTQYIDQDGEIWVTININKTSGGPLYSGGECTYELNLDLFENTYNAFNDDWLWERFFNEYHKMPLKGDNWCFV